ncbi:MAG TPA: POT family MFS transporter [Prosthecobacter sp.]|nr:POT family MFS transporter [Prosthecobacter sp.]
MAYRTAPVATSSMPPGILYIIGNELAERFSFYGMRAILMIFMTTALRTHGGAPDLMSEAKASEWIHNYMFAVYITPLLGGLIADLWQGKYRTIIVLSLVYCAGHLVLALDNSRNGLFWGLALVAIGAGGIKPCVASHVGDQFNSKNSHLLPRIYHWFYFSINLGSMISMILTPWLMRKYGSHVAFGVPGVLMFVATVVFWMGRHQFAHIPPEPRKFKAEISRPEVLRSLLGLVMIYGFIAMFWGLFDQTASRWVAQATRMDLNLSGVEVLPDQLQSINPILVMIMIPLFSLVIYPLVGRLVTLTPLRKIWAGFALASISFVIPALVESWIEAGHRPTVWWQVLAYVLLTGAEVMISITALEFSYTQSPPRLKSFVMGLFYAGVSLGNLFVSRVNASIESSGFASKLVGPAYYWFFVKCMAVTTVLFVFVAMFYKGRTYLQDEEPAAPEPHG